MRVVLSQDNAPRRSSAVYLIYGVGARSEEKGRTGFAHLFEHMMFQGSTNAPKGVHFRTVESNGGYAERLDASGLHRLLRGAAVEQTAPLRFGSNRTACADWRSLMKTSTTRKRRSKQERRMRIDNQPYVTAIVENGRNSLPQLENSHSLIGSFEDLNAATVEDVSKFFKTLLRSEQCGSGHCRRYRYRGGQEAD